MAAAVDAEIASYRSMQEELQKMRTDQQLLMGQQNENEMVKQVCVYIHSCGKDIIPQSPMYGVLML